MERVDVLLVWYLAIFCLFVPWIALKSSRRVRAGAAVPPRKVIFLNVLVMQVFFLGIALFTARLRWLHLWETGHYDLAAITTALLVLVLGLVSVRLRWNATADAERRQLMLSRPREPKDLWMWLLVSLAAGTVEEIVYRGVLYQLLTPLTGPWLAAGICIAAFVAGHAGRSWHRMAVIGFLACGCHLLVWMTSALYLAMAVHFLYDFLAGVLYLRLARELPAAAPPLPCAASQSAGT